MFLIIPIKEPEQTLNTRANKLTFSRAAAKKAFVRFSFRFHDYLFLCHDAMKWPSALFPIT